jgi:hypothetical protein
MNTDFFVHMGIKDPMTEAMKKDRKDYPDHIVSVQIDNTTMYEFDISILSQVPKASMKSERRDKIHAGENKRIPNLFTLSKLDKMDVIFECSCVLVKGETEMVLTSKKLPIDYLTTRDANSTIVYSIIWRPSSNYLTPFPVCSLRLEHWKMSEGSDDEKMHDS